jgi:hypothetical protein
MTQNSLLLASALASLFGITACGGDDPDTAQSGAPVTVRCGGINQCAGQGDCAGTRPDGTTHTCAGQNACSGQGWLEVPEAECTAKGGQVLS